MHVNLIPRQLQLRQVVRLRLKQMSLAAGVLTAVVGSLTLLQWRQCHSAADRASILEQQCLPLQQMQADVEQSRQGLQDLASREQISAPLQDSASALSLLGWVATAAEKSGGKVSLDMLAAEPPASTSEGKESYVLQLQGQGTEQLAIAQFVASLRELDVFQRVELTSTESHDWYGGQAQKFSIECCW